MGVMRVEIPRHELAELGEALALARHVAAQRTVLNGSAGDMVARDALAQQQIAHACKLVQLARLLETHALDERRIAPREAIRHEAAVAAGGSPSDAPRLDQRDLVAVLGEIERGGAS